MLPIPMFFSSSSTPGPIVNSITAGDLGTKLFIPINIDIKPGFTDADYALIGIRTPDNQISNYDGSGGYIGVYKDDFPWGNGPGEVPFNEGVIDYYNPDYVFPYDTTTFTTPIVWAGGESDLFTYSCVHLFDDFSGQPAVTGRQVLSITIKPNETFTYMIPPQSFYLSNYNFQTTAFAYNITNLSGGIEFVGTQSIDLALLYFDGVTYGFADYT